ncbi:MAG: hypothetical protein SPG61_02790 [Arcanobacterium sp.]|nr:hypothetical protein [Arcanobacterium sp.]
MTRRARVVTLTLTFLSILLLAGFVYALVFAPNASEVEKGFNSAKSSSASSSENGSSGEADNSDAKENEDTAKSQQTAPDVAVTKATATVAGENITVLGDSVIAMVDPTFQERWPGIVVDGEKNRSYFAVSEMIAKHLTAGTLRHYVVIGIANNAKIPATEIDRWVQEIGSDRIMVLVTGHGTPRTPWINEANTEIYAAAKRYPKQVVVADWFKIAEANPAVLYRDQTHPNLDGNIVFVDEVARALEAGSKLPSSVEMISAEEAKARQVAQENADAATNATTDENTAADE